MARKEASLFRCIIGCWCSLHFWGVASNTRGTDGVESWGIRKLCRAVLGTVVTWRRFGNFRIASMACEGRALRLLYLYQ